MKKNILFLIKKNFSSVWQTYYCFVSIIFIMLILVSCDTKNISEETQENKITQQKTDKTITQSNSNKLILQKEETKKNVLSNTANEKVLSKKVEQFKNSIENKEIIEGSMESFIAKNGLPYNWTSSQWVIIAKWLSKINKEEYAIFTKNLSRSSCKVRILDKQSIIKYAKDIMNTAKLVTNPFRANRLFLEASDIQRWYIDQENGIKTKVFILERMADGLGYDRDLYISVSTGVADSYARNGEYKKAENEFNQIIKSIPNITPDEKANILYYTALAYISPKAPKELRKKGFDFLKLLAEDKSISTEYSGMANHTYNLISKKIKKEVGHIQKND